MSFARWALVTVPGVLLLGFLSGSSVPAGADNPWYAALAKPAITPPDWVFPVAWTILYVLLGLALAIVLNARGARGRGAAVALFVAQLAANLVWQPLFFGGHRVVLALVVIAVMVVLALAATLSFARIRAIAAWLMVPYLAWIVFAGVLTWRIHQLNPNAENLVPSAASTQIAL
jgi:tryptophan-rich sensory protein